MKESEFPRIIRQGKFGIIVEGHEHVAWFHRDEVTHVELEKIYIDEVKGTIKGSTIHLKDGSIYTTTVHPAAVMGMLWR